MESTVELKEIDIKNCTCYYFHDIIRVWDTNIYSSDILLDKKPYKEKYKISLIYDISNKTSMGTKPCVVASIKYMGLLKVMIALDI